MFFTWCFTYILLVVSVEQIFHNGADLNGFVERIQENHVKIFNL